MHEFLGGDDGAVVAHLGVVHEALAGGQRAAQQLLGLGPEAGAAQGAQAVGQGGHHVGGDVAGVGARVAGDLVPLVQRLQHAQGFGRAEAQQGAGLLLQQRQVVGRRRRVAFLLLAHLHDLRACAPHFVDDGAGPLRVLQARGPAGTLPGAAEGAEIGLDRPEGLGAEVADLLLPGGHQGQGGGLHPAGREAGVVAAAQGPRQVQADDPVRLGPALRGAEQVVVGSGGLQGPEAFPDGRVGLGADPQAPGGPLPAGQAQDPAGHQLPLPAGVGGDHQGAHVLSVQELLDGVELVGAAADHRQPHLLREHGQAFQVPGFPALVVAFRVGQLHQVAHGPGHDPGTAFLPALAPLRAA